MLELTTISAVKTELSIDSLDVSRDTDIGLAIQVASQLIENYCNNKFEKQQVTETTETETNMEILKHYPVRSDELVTVLYESNGGIVPTAEYSIDKVSGIINKPLEKLELTYYVGYILPNAVAPLVPDLPILVQYACTKLSVAVLNSKGLSEKRNLQSEWVFDYRYTYEDSKVTENNGVMLPASIAAMLTTYTRLV